MFTQKSFQLFSCCTETKTNKRRNNHELTHYFRVFSRFLVEFGCDVNAQDSDGWTPLHCAASCNNLAMVKFLVESGACLFASTLSDHETPAEKCEEDEEGFDGCSEYLYSTFFFSALHCLTYKLWLLLFFFSILTNNLNRDNVLTPFRLFIQKVFKRNWEL